MSDEPRIEMTPEHLAKAVQLALAATDAHEFGPLDPECIGPLLAAHGDAKPTWCAYAFDPQGETWCTAITGNGENSQANAEFYATARRVVLGLVDLVERERAAVGDLVMQSVGLGSSITALRSSADHWQFEFERVVDEQHRAEKSRDAVITAVRECIADWREQAAAEEHCQRTGGNPKGAMAYRRCADELEAALKDGAT